MRTIKFRAWDKNKQELKDNKDWFDIDVITGSLFRKEHILMQFTGLKDKSGKEIYEGDILSQLAHSEKIRKKPRWLKVVEWVGAGFNIRNGKSFEVIGNIFENPKLLEDKDEKN